jgi:hypothetical protein
MCAGKTVGNVRILSRRSAERALLKGFAGSVLDVAFAHSEDIMLAAVDEMGCVHVYRCSTLQDGKILYPCNSTEGPSKMSFIFG